MEPRLLSCLAPVMRRRAVPCTEEYRERISASDCIAACTSVQQPSDVLATHLLPACRTNNHQRPRLEINGQRTDAMARVPRRLAPRHSTTASLIFEKML